jgi:hypothetical protein
VSRWSWVGITFIDDHGNYVAWELLQPDGQINYTQQLNRFGEVIGARLQVDLIGLSRNWDGILRQLQEQPAIGPSED